MVDDVGGVADGIQVDAGAELAGDRAVIVDGDGELAGDAVARADDRAIGEIVDRGAAGRQFGRGRGLEIDGIIAAGGRTRVLADDLAMIVDGGIVTGPNRVIVRGADDPAVIVVDRDGRGNDVGEIDGLTAGAGAAWRNIAVAIQTSRDQVPRIVDRCRTMRKIAADLEGVIIVGVRRAEDFRPSVVCDRDNAAAVKVFRVERPFGGRTDRTGIR
jgi:hypothetical protein